jgi:4'-phosphopantetheinyl transferase EntD
MPGPHIDYRCARLDELTGWTRRPLAMWLTSRETEELQTWRDTARRAQWLAGRALVKQLVLDRIPQALGEAHTIELRSLRRDGRPTRPMLAIAGQPIPCSISLSHTDQLAAAAVCTTSGCSVGIDIVARVGEDTRLASRWFTPAERNWIHKSGTSPAVVWGAKEAAYKAVNQGEPFSPDRFEILPGADGTLQWQYQGGPSHRECSLHTWEAAGHLVVLAVVAGPDSPGFERADCRREVAHVS